MKRILTATALTLSMAGTAFAATEAEMTQIQNYLPDADISSWSDEEVAQAMNIITTTDSRADTIGQLNSLYSGTDYVSGAEISEAEMVVLDSYVEGVDYSMLPQATVDAALAVANSSGSESDKQGTISQLLSTDTTPMMAGNTASAAEMALIQQAAPDVDVSTLSDEQVTAALAMIYSNGMSNDTASRVQAYLAQ